MFVLLFVMALALMTVLVMAFVNAVVMFTSKLCTFGNWRGVRKPAEVLFTGWRKELALSTRRRSTTVWNQKVRITSAFNLHGAEQNISVYWIRN
jgi:hypothetical protein